MYENMNPGSTKTKSFAGPLLEKVRKDLARRDTEKPQVVFLPVAKPERAERDAEKPKVVFLPVARQDKPTAAKGKVEVQKPLTERMQTPQKETLPYRSSEPVRATTLPYQTSEPVKLLPLAASQETERARGGFGAQGRNSGFGGNFGGGQVNGRRQENTPVMLPLASAARDTMPYGGIPRLQFSSLTAQAEQEKAQTLPMPSGTDAGGGTSYDVQAKLDKLRTNAAAFRTAQSDFLTIGGDPGTDAQLERTEREIAALTPIYEQKKKQEAEQSDAEKWVRWNVLASLNRPFTEGEKAEAKDAMREMGYVLSRIPSSQEEREKRSSYEQLYGVLHNKTSLGASIAAGFITAVPFAKTALEKSDGWLGEYKREMEEKYPELSIKDPTLKETMAAKGSIAASFQDAKDTSPIGYAGGQVASNVVQMYGLGKLFGAAVKGAPLLSKLPTAIQGALATGGATGTMGALHEAEEGGSAEDVAKSFGVNALAGGAGSFASAGVGALGTKALFGLSVQNPVPAVILRDGLAGAAFSAGSMGTRYVLDENYRPTSEEAAKDMVVGFFFGAVTSLLKSANMTGEAKARMSETVEQMKRDYGTILADSGGSVTLDALDDLAAKSAEVRNTLRTTQFVGQQDTVNGVMAFLDTLDDAVARARAGMGTGITGWNGNMQGMPPSGAGGLFGLPGAALAPSRRMGGMPIPPGPAAVKDDWETALEEAVAEQGIGEPENVDISGESGIVFDRDTEGAGDVLKNANFAQSTYRSSFSIEGKSIYSDIAGAPIKTVDDLASALRKGLVKTSDVQIDYIIRDGNVLILNTRSAHALTQAGVPRSQWNAVNRTGVDMYEKMLDGQLKNNGLTSAGTPTARMTGGH
ncbi:hypothetical protein KL86CLO1_11171 [uncultured Eubacteriales bacterium]|uniref:Uncharacterized protein n=1 Tax=uncultured Eubacteriales bacterium TaxID=172733 RepID=A0A212JIN7_9FIRM|nr:hypothetical protein KL86CLO1_11171 [uncultured Eubacteriales bacterium]